MEECMCVPSCVVGCPIYVHGCLQFHIQSSIEAFTPGTGSASNANNNNSNSIQWYIYIYIPLDYNQKLCSSPRDISLFSCP